MKVIIIFIFIQDHNSDVESDFSLLTSGTFPSSFSSVTFVSTSSIAGGTTTVASSSPFSSLSLLTFSSAFSFWSSVSSFSFSTYNSFLFSELTETSVFDSSFATFD